MDIQKLENSSEIGSATAGSVAGLADDWETIHVVKQIEAPVSLLHIPNAFETKFQSADKQL